MNQSCPNWNVHVLSTFHHLDLTYEVIINNYNWMILMKWSRYMHSISNHFKKTPRKHGFYFAPHRNVWKKYACKYPMSHTAEIHMGTSISHFSYSKLYSGVELRTWTFQWDLTLHLLIWTVSHINRYVHQWFHATYILVNRINNLLSIFFSQTCMKRLWIDKKNVDSEVDYIVIRQLRLRNPFM